MPAARRTLVPAVPVVTAAIAGLLVLLPGLATPASAHPFGDPQVAQIELVADDTVAVRWKIGMADDLTLLGVELGVLPEDRIYLDGAVIPEEGDELLVRESPEFADYLLETIGVRAADADCVGEVAETGHVLEEGVRLEFTCPEPVAAADVRIEILNDLHPAYATLASGPSGQRFAYDGESPTHTWTLGSGGSGSDGAGAAADADAGAGDAVDSTGRSAALQIGLVLGVIAVGVAAVLGGRAVLRRRRGAGAGAADEGAGAGVRDATGDPDRAESGV